MRLSTQTLHALRTQSILDQQAQISKVGEQLATGKRIVKPSDDPSGAAHLLGLQQASDINAQYADNRATAERQLSAEEGQLNTVTDALGSAKQLLVHAATGTLSNADRNSLADQLEGVYGQLLASANAKDGSGNYIFAGYKTNTAPFDESGDHAYHGDEGQREVQVDGSRQMKINDPGDDVFAATTANAKYVATAGSDNKGSATYHDLDLVSAKADDYGDTFSVKFSGSGDDVTYSVTDTTTGDTLVNGAAYQPGQSIALGDSLETRIKGEPDDGDTFTFAKGRGQDDNILDAISDMVGVLRDPVDDGSDQARLTNSVNRANRQVDNSLDNVLSVRSRLGSRLGELDNLDNLGEDRNVNYARNISSVRDVDMVSAISNFSLDKVALQAAQQTFLSVQQMSLFNML